MKSPTTFSEIVRHLYFNDNYPKHKCFLFYKDKYYYYSNDGGNYFVDTIDNIIYKILQSFNAAIISGSLSNLQYSICCYIRLSTNFENYKLNNYMDQDGELMCEILKSDIPTWKSNL